MARDRAARRLAPVSLSWLGYPLPLGLEGVDYFLSDEVASPGTGAETWRLPRAPFAFLHPRGSGCAECEETWQSVAA